MFDLTDLYKNENERLQQDEVLDFNNGYPLQPSYGRRNMLNLSELGGERIFDSDVEDEELLHGPNSVESDNGLHTEQSEIHEEPLRTVDPNGSLMHGTDSGSGTLIPGTDSGSGAVTLSQNEPRAINGSRAMMPGTDSGPGAGNTNCNAERIGPGVDL